MAVGVHKSHVSGTDCVGSLSLPWCGVLEHVSGGCGYICVVGGGFCCGHQGAHGIHLPPVVSAPSMFVLYVGRVGRHFNVLWSCAVW